MSREQVKTEINEILQNLPKENLEGILEYLKAAQKLSAQRLSLVNNFQQILEEDRTLLTKLAQ